MKTEMTDMENEISELRKMVKEQLKIIEKQSQHINDQSEQIDALQEQLNLLKALVYGKTSEKKAFKPDPALQMSFLDDVEAPPVPAEPVEQIHVEAHSKKKKGRKPLPEDLPREEVIHDIPEADKQCACGSFLSRIGEEISEQLSYIPATLKVIRHIRPKYACKSCEGIESEEKTVWVAPRPKLILPKSIASAQLLAQIIVAKFADSLPFYRQEQQFKRLGYKISRANMANWCITLLEKLKAVDFLLKQEIRSGPLIHMDETHLQVLKEENRSPHTKSWIWVMCTGASENPGVYFHYNPSRSAAVAKRLLNGYEGTVLTDGYSGYSFINDEKEMRHAGCWAHCRRNFTDILAAMGKSGNTKADEALTWIGALYAIEKNVNELSPVPSPDEIRAIRQEKSLPLINAFHQWLLATLNETNPKGLLGKAIRYALNQWEGLTLYLNDGAIPIDNNPAENAIRPFVVGRKNFLFSDTAKGAEATALLYSLVETAKANGLNPAKYLTTLFEKLPYTDSKADVKSLLPQFLKEDTTLLLN